MGGGREGGKEGGGGMRGGIGEGRGGGGGGSERGGGREKEDSFTFVMPYWQANERTARIFYEVALC